MKIRSCYRPAVLVSMILLLQTSLIGEEPALDDAWELSRRYQFNEAVKAFSDKDDITSPSVAAEAHFGLAVNLINRQPKTRANIERARRILEGLLAAEPESDLGIAARYFLGRIAQLHLQEPDIESAIEHFGYLVEHHPDNFWGQVAATKYGFLNLYQVMPIKERTALFMDLEKLADHLTSPYLRSNFHFMLGTAAVRFRKLPERALEHFIQAERFGLIKGRARTDGLLRIGELARELERWDVAERYYQQYLDEFRRDPPRDLVKDRLTEVRRMKAPTSSTAMAPCRPRK